MNDMCINIMYVVPDMCSSDKLDNNEIQLQILTSLSEQELLAFHQSSQLQVLVGMYLEIEMLYFFVSNYVQV